MPLTNVARIWPRITGCEACHLDAEIGKHDALRWFVPPFPRSEVATSRSQGLRVRASLVFCLLTPASSNRDAPAGARRQTVLVVDDEPDLREAIKQFLEDTVKGIRVITAPGGRAGLLLLETETVDVIVTDFKMPEMDGLEFLAAARLRAPRAARVLVTAFPDTDLAIRAVNEGGVESFFTKPFIPAKVIAVVQGLLADRRKQADESMEFARSFEALRKRVKEGKDAGV